MSTKMKGRKPKSKKNVSSLAKGKAPARGWLGPGRGSSFAVKAPPEWRATTFQACGLWPWAAGTGTPLVGVPLGRHIHNGATVCCDPISWFQRANLISNPSCFILGIPGLGKSTVVRRMATGLSGYGVIPLILGDTKPDYVELVRALGGQVIPLGRGRGYLNVLDPGEATEAAEKLRSHGFREEAAKLMADAHGRRLTMVAALLTIMRAEPPTDREETILDRALKWLDEHHEGIPVLGDLLRVIQEGPEPVRAVALDRGDHERYQSITENLEASLIGLVGGGRLGEIFSKQTTNPMKRDRAVVYDVSSIDETEVDLQAASLLATWSSGFGTTNVANALADAGLEPRRHYFVVLDELWRALRAGRGMVDRVDALTRLNRTRGVGLAMVSHTMKDLLGLPTEEERMKAIGFIERSGMVICGGLPSGEMEYLRQAISMARAEEELLASWQDPGAWDAASNRETDPPGRGKFLIKVGGRPGIPIQVKLTETELTGAVHDTSALWHEQSRVGTRDEAR